MALTRLTALAMQQENGRGTFRATTLTAPAAHSKYLLQPGANLNLEPVFFQQNFLRSTLTPDLDAVGIKVGRGSFSINLTGHAIATPVKPVAALPMRAAGMREAVTQQVTLGTFSGSTPAVFRHGEIIVDKAADPNRGRVLHDTWPEASGDTVLYYEPLDGTNSGVMTTTDVTGQTTTTTATITSDDGVIGFTWYPVSNPTITFAFNNGTEVGATSGITFAEGDIIRNSSTTPVSFGEVIRVWNVLGETGGTDTTITGNMSVRLFSNSSWITGQSITSDLDLSTPAVYFHATLNGNAAIEDHPTVSMVLFEDGTYKAVAGVAMDWALAGASGEPARWTFTPQGPWNSEGDAGKPTGVVFEDKTAPVLRGVCWKLGLESDTNQGDLYSPRVTSFGFSGGNDIALNEDMCNASGVDYARIVGRAGTCNLNFEHDLESVYPIWARLADGEPGRIQGTIGSVAGNKFYISAGGLQATSVPIADLNGTSQKNATFNLTGGKWSNVSDTPGVDNEFVITYFD